ncbi:sugar transporter, putative [Cordyceps militaris CM01]|uniref:Sugar transporter, putative n=1 Tax=Cordyceps militaris (strain CM01) TaxID=983644 RepID=G3JRW2_CORMM|nr:sugar transporter, putative [Cordyceps militaris CM01]EGX88555.1 sugar transporter, putative [Cordyceps militaris CM01]
MRSVPTGTWMPACVPESTPLLSVLLLLCSIVQSTTGGYDGSMLNGLNILPSYTDYFKLTPATKGLNTASTFIGGFIGPIFAGVIADRLGRRPAIFWGTVVTLVGIVLQGAAQNIAMFVIARIILGAGGQISGVAGVVYLSETFPSRWRTWGLGLLNNCFYIGALIAAGITLGTSEWQSTWAWRAPSFFQAIFSITCLLFLPFIPESPRWLVGREHYEDARLVVALTNANGNLQDPVAMAVYKQIVDTLDWEKKEGRTMSPMEIFKTPTARKRVLIGGSAGPFSCIAGNIIASYYLGDELKTAGIDSADDQLKANVVLNIWCLFCCLLGTQLADTWGRKPTALLSQSLLIVCLFIIGGLSKMYADDKSGASQGLVYGDVAVMFLFQGFYSIAWTPLLTLYPPEVMAFPTRANGNALSSFALNGLALKFERKFEVATAAALYLSQFSPCMCRPGLLLVFVMPIGLDNIGWKMYMINGSWDIITLILIAVYWVETKGKTLEEIDALFEGGAHSTVRNVEDVRKGREVLDVDKIEKDLYGEVELTKFN